MYDGPNFDSEATANAQIADKKRYDAASDLVISMFADAIDDGKK